MEILEESEKDFVRESIKELFNSIKEQKDLKKLFGNEIDKKIKKMPIWKIGDLQNNLKEINNERENGVYFIVKLKENQQLTIKEPTDKSLPKLSKGIWHTKEMLSQKKDLDKNKNRIIYIGKAERKGGLQARIKNYMKFKNHMGGKEIYQIERYKEWGICWITVEEKSKSEKKAEKAETLLINAYNEKYNKIIDKKMINKDTILPFANKKR